MKVREVSNARSPFITPPQKKKLKEIKTNKKASSVMTEKRSFLIRS
ncbi:hypothetical protein EW15_0450 [Prochlorococcus sp. MIT 0801]|nr:hypothetical protein EW15_0450 [Prochlorococcus sp. MIT 0801]